MLSSKNISCLQCPSMECLINRNCDDQWKRNFDSEKNVNVYRKGEYIFREGFPIVGVYFISAGKVKVVSINEYGKEHVVRFARDGHILGHVATNSEKFTIDAVSMDDSIICFFKNEFLMRALENNNSLLYGMMMYYSCELRKSEIRTRNIALMNVRERIAHSLILLFTAFGSCREFGKKKLNMKISGAEISKIAGTTPEEVSRTLSELRQQKIISVDQKFISILDWEKLEKVIAGYTHEWGCCEKAF